MEEDIAETSEPKVFPVGIYGVFFGEESDTVSGMDQMIRRYGLVIDHGHLNLIR
jgi:hypothetical protein